MAAQAAQVQMKKYRLCSSDWRIEVGSVESM